MIHLACEMTYAETIEGPLASQFEAGTGRSVWLGERLFVGRGRLTGAKAISYEIYRVL
jgi:hypothetical protein